MLRALPSRHSSTPVLLRGGEENLAHLTTLPFKRELIPFVVSYYGNFGARLSWFTAQMPFHFPLHPGLLHLVVHSALRGLNTQINATVSLSLY